MGNVTRLCYSLVDLNGTIVWINFVKICFKSKYWLFLYSPHSIKWNFVMRRKCDIVYLVDISAVSDVWSAVTYAPDLLQVTVCYVLKLGWDRRMFVCRTAPTVTTQTWMGTATLFVKCKKFDICFQLCLLIDYTFYIANLCSFMLI